MTPMPRPILLTPEQSNNATKGDIVVAADSRTLYIKLTDCNCRSFVPSPYNGSVYNCCWLTLGQLDSLMQLENRLISGGVSLESNPDFSRLHQQINMLDLRLNMLNLQLEDELRQLKRQCNEQLELIQRLLPSTVAVVEDGERKLQLQP